MVFTSVLRPRVPGMMFGVELCTHAELLKSGITATS